MKTFEEHKKEFKDFNTFLGENDSNLLRDLEGLSINEKTYSLDDINNAFFNVITENKFANEEFLEIIIDEAYEVDCEDYTRRGSSDISVKFAGNIAYDLYSEEIVKEVIEELSTKDNNYEQKRWSEHEIQEALDYVEWEDYVTLDWSDVEAIITGMNSDAGNATIEYELAENSYFVTADINNMWDDFVSLLEGT